MNAFSYLLAGQNIPFLVALGCSLALALVQIVSGFGDHHADMDGDGHGDVHADTHADAEHDVDSAELTDILGLLGIGKIPLMLVLIGLLGSFGALGLLANSLLALGGNYPSWGFALVFVGSLVLALPITRALSTMFVQIAPRSSTAITMAQLVGRVGTVVSATVSNTYGRVAVRDPYGSIHTVYALIETGEPLPERSEVALVRYDEARRCFIVMPLGNR